MTHKVAEYICREPLTCTTRVRHVAKVDVGVKCHSRLLEDDADSYIGTVGEVEMYNCDR